MRVRMVMMPRTVSSIDALNCGTAVAISTMMVRDRL